MTTYKVASGHLFRRHDYSVRGYSGDVLAGADADVVAEADPWRDLIIAADSGGGGGPSVFTRTPIPVPDVLDRLIYVDSVAGVDTSTYPTRGTIGAPFQTIAYAIPGGSGNAARDGFGDRIHCKKGQTHSISGGVLTHINWSGNSSTRPFILTSYGTGARPILNSGNSTAIQNDYRTILHDLWFIGLDVTASTYDHTSTCNGMFFTWLLTNVLVEDCYVHKFSSAINFQGSTDYYDPGTYLLPWNSNPRHTNCRARACTLADTDHQSTGTTGQGSFNSNVDTLWFEQCIFINCGWDPSAPSYASAFKHSMYIHAGYTSGLHFLGATGAGGSTDVHVINNICLNTDGFTIRTGGTITGNVFSRCQSGLQVGQGDTGQDGGITLDSEDNIVLESRRTNGMVPVIGFGVGNIGASSVFKRNICGRSMETHASVDIKSLQFLHPDFEADGTTVGTHNVAAPLEISDCIFWHSGYISQRDTASFYTGLTTWLRNDFQLDDIYASPGNPEAFRVDGAGISVNAKNTGTGNNFWQSGAHQVDHLWYANPDSGGNNISQLLTAPRWNDTTATFVQNTYVSPERTLSTYATSLGLADLAALEAVFRARSYDNWSDNYTANAICTYIKAGFGR